MKVQQGFWGVFKSKTPVRGASDLLVSDLPWYPTKILKCGSETKATTDLRAQKLGCQSVAKIREKNSHGHQKF